MRIAASDQALSAARRAPKKTTTPARRGTGGRHLPSHGVWAVARSGYRTGSELADTLGPAADYSDAVRIARSMSVGGLTMWTSVYNLTCREARLFYRTDHPQEYRDALGVDATNDGRGP